MIPEKPSRLNKINKLLAILVGIFYISMLGVFIWLKVQDANAPAPTPPVQTKRIPTLTPASSSSAELTEKDLQSLDESSVSADLTDLEKDLQGL